MSIIVQKFGGTSVADAEKILSAARKAIRAQQAGHQVVMVVSAMGKNTDMLVDLARQITDRPPAREMDMLLSTGEQVSVALMAMAIDALGCRAVSLTGAQIGIKTDSSHTKARIKSISTDRLRQLLDEGHIVIAAGFQGIDENLNITTLGRGGSDLTAVALAAVLQAEACEIYTDVDGVYTTDPRKISAARRVAQISYDEMLELASLGAGVLHSRSVEFGKKFGVPIHVRSSFVDQPGTMVVAEPEVPGQPVGGAALTQDEARVTVSGVPDRPGTSYAILSQIAAKNISVDMIVQNVGAAGKADISFTVLRDDLPLTREAVGEALRELGAGTLEDDDNVSKVSAVGLGMARQTGVAHQMFRALADEGINIQMITTSEIKISALVARPSALDALRAVHETFHLETPPAGTRPPSAGDRPAATPDALAVVTSLAGMEDLVIEGVGLDDTQARLTISDVPDQPGIAATVFEKIAGGGLFVDMIVQSSGHAGRAILSFTVPAGDLEAALQLTGEIAAEAGCGPVTSSPHVAKLSVSGVGMRSHTGVAMRMFQSLAEAGINVEMINTSEMRVNVVVDGQHGPRGLACLEEAFADALLS
ncbi:MAG: aspartate kinase [Planctomycetales bacterium]|nr:aspartate kinase [Planctomycetales bacterium]NIP86297.1 aspartate kinase [Planctomycetales bacterium]